MKKRTIISDLLIYIFTSARLLLFKGKFNDFIYDVSCFFQWRAIRYSNQGILSYQIPWLVFSCISHLDKMNKKGLNVFEYGSGGSTIYFSKNGANIVSIEHDRNWYQNAKKVIEQNGFSVVEYNLIEPQIYNTTVQKDCKNYNHYISCFTEYQGYEFENYATFINKYPDEYFDMVVVDGRVRHSCIFHSIPKVKKGGMLLVDNADRKYYTEDFSELENHSKWEKIIFRGHFPYGPASILNTTHLYLKK